MQSWFWHPRFSQAYSRYLHHPTAEHLTDQASLPIQVQETVERGQKEISMRVFTDENFECPPPLHNGLRDLSCRLSVSFCNIVWAVKTGPILTAKSVENTHTHSFTWPSSIISIIDVEVRPCWRFICCIYSTEIGRSNRRATLTKDKWNL